MLIIAILFPFSDRFLRGTFLSHFSYVSRGPHIDAILQQFEAEQSQTGQ